MARKTAKRVAKPRPRRKSRRRGAGWGMRMLALLLLIGLIAVGWAWWEAQHWRPDEAAWPDQGALISADDGAVNFRTLEGLGAAFAYLEASGGVDERDARFVDNFAEARAAGLPIGAVHIFDPCTLADEQSANFVIMVPRDAELLPPQPSRKSGH